LGASGRENVFTGWARVAAYPCLPYRHFAIQFARALGSDRVIAFSHSENKKVPSPASVMFLANLFAE
jgi:hypothetical protein